MKVTEIIYTMDRPRAVEREKKYYIEAIFEALQELEEIKEAIQEVESAGSPSSYELADEIQCMREEIELNLNHLEAIERKLRNLTPEGGKWDF